MELTNDLQPTRSRRTRGDAGEAVTNQPLPEPEMGGRDEHTVARILALHELRSSRLQTGPSAIRRHSGHSGHEPAGTAGTTGTSPPVCVLAQCAADASLEEDRGGENEGKVSG